MKRTIDREQEQARLRADALGADGRAGRDLAWIVAVGVVVAAGAWSPPRRFERHRRLGRRPVGRRPQRAAGPARRRARSAPAIFAVRRYRDARADRATLFRPLVPRHADRAAQPPLPRRRLRPDAQADPPQQRPHRRAVRRPRRLPGDQRHLRPRGRRPGHDRGRRPPGRGRSGPSDRAVRYGGDQFVLFCPDVSTAVSAERIAKPVLQAIETPFEVGDDRRPALSATVGMAITEERCTRPDEVLRDADAALYQARPQGPGRFVMFDRAMRDQITPSTAERRLRQALDNGEFRLYYQPIVSLWTKRLVGVEALLRWNDPTRGMVNPDEFLPALEETGLIVPIGSWVLEEVARQSRAWQDALPRPAGHQHQGQRVGPPAGPGQLRRATCADVAGGAAAPTRPASTSRSPRACSQADADDDVGDPARGQGRTASRSPSTTSAPATRRSATCASSSSTCSRSTSPSSTASATRRRTPPSSSTSSAWPRRSAS